MLLCCPVVIIDIHVLSTILQEIELALLFGIMRCFLDTIYDLSYIGLEDFVVHEFI